MHFMQKEQTWEQALVNFYVSVLTFNRIAGNTPDNKELIPTYLKLLVEEVTELLEADKNKDRKEFIDGLLDVGVIGSFLYALVFEEDFDFIPEEFMDDCGTSIPELLEELKGEVDRCKGDWFEKDLEYVANTVMYVFINISQLANVDMVKAMELVCKNNMSKFVPEEEAKALGISPEVECSLIEAKGRYGDVSYVLREGMYVFLAGKDVKNNITYDKPKIVKPTFFVELDLEELL